MRPLAELGLWVVKIFAVIYLAMGCFVGVVYIGSCLHRLRQRSIKENQQAKNHDDQFEFASWFANYMEALHGYDLILEVDHCYSDDEKTLYHFQGSLSGRLFVYYYPALNRLDVTDNDAPGGGRTLLTFTADWDIDEAVAETHQLHDRYWRWEASS